MRMPPSNRLATQGYRSRPSNILSPKSSSAKAFRDRLKGGSGAATDGETSADAKAEPDEVPDPDQETFTMDESDAITNEKSALSPKQDSADAGGAGVNSFVTALKRQQLKSTNNQNHNHRRWQQNNNSARNTSIKMGNQEATSIDQNGNEVEEDQENQFFSANNGGGGAKKSSTRHNKSSDKEAMEVLCSPRAMRSPRAMIATSSPRALSSPRGMGSPRAALSPNKTRESLTRERRLQQRKSAIFKTGKSPKPSIVNGVLEKHQQQEKESASTATDMAKDENIAGDDSSSSPQVLVLRENHRLGPDKPISIAGGKGIASSNNSWKSKQRKDVGAMVLGTVAATINKEKNDEPKTSEQASMVGGEDKAASTCQAESQAVKSNSEGSKSQDDISKDAKEQVVKVQEDEDSSPTNMDFASKRKAFNTKGKNRHQRFIATAKKRDCREEASQVNSASTKKSQDDNDLPFKENNAAVLSDKAESLAKTHTANSGVKDEEKSIVIEHNDQDNSLKSSTACDANEDDLDFASKRAWASNLCKRRMSRTLMAKKDSKDGVSSDDGDVNQDAKTVEGTVEKEHISQPPAKTVTAHNDQDCSLEITEECDANMDNLDFASKRKWASNLSKRRMAKTQMATKEEKVRVNEEEKNDRDDSLKTPKEKLDFAPERNPLGPLSKRQDVATTARAPSSPSASMITAEQDNGTDKLLHPSPPPADGQVTSAKSPPSKIVGNPMSITAVKYLSQPPSPKSSMQSTEIEEDGNMPFTEKNEGHKQESEFSARLLAKRKQMFEKRRQSAQGGGVVVKKEVSDDKAEDTIRVNDFTIPSVTVKCKSETAPLSMPEKTIGIVAKKDPKPTCAKAEHSTFPNLALPMKIEIPTPKQGSNMISTPGSKGSKNLLTPRLILQEKRILSLEKKRQVYSGVIHQENEDSKPQPAERYLSEDNLFTTFEPQWATAAVAAQKLDDDKGHVADAFDFTSNGEKDDTSTFASSAFSSDVFGDNMTSMFNHQEESGNASVEQKAPPPTPPMEWLFDDFGNKNHFNNVNSVETSQVKDIQAATESAEVEKDECNADDVMDEQVMQAEDSVDSPNKGSLVSHSSESLVESGSFNSKPSKSSQQEFQAEAPNATEMEDTSFAAKIKSFHDGLNHGHQATFSEIVADYNSQVSKLEEGNQSKMAEVEFLKSELTEQHNQIRSLLEAQKSEGDSATEEVKVENSDCSSEAVVAALRQELTDLRVKLDASEVAARLNSEQQSKKSGPMRGSGKKTKRGFSFRKGSRAKFLVK